MSEHIDELKDQKGKGLGGNFEEIEEIVDLITKKNSEFAQAILELFSLSKGKTLTDIMINERF